MALGRFLSGVGVGIGCQAVPVYTAEVSSAECALPACLFNATFARKCKETRAAMLTLRFCRVPFPPPGLSFFSCLSSPSCDGPSAAGRYRGVTGTAFQLAINLGIFLGFLVNAAVIDTYASGASTQARIVCTAHTVCETPVTTRTRIRTQYRSSGPFQACKVSKHRIAFALAPAKVSRAYFLGR